MKNIDRPTLILAFVLAVFLWVYVHASQDSPRRVFTRPVQLVGKVSGIKTSVHPDYSTVNIVITGRPEAVNGVLPDEIKVKVNVSDIMKVTGKSVPHQTLVTMPKGVELVGKPPTITVIAEALEQKSLPVTMLFIPPPPPGTPVGEYLVQPTDVPVEGTPEALQRVQYVTVSLDPSEPIPGGMKITPRAVDENGDRVDDANVLAESILVRLASGRGALGTRKVAVRVPEFSRQPRHYLVSVAKITPDQVTLSGEPSVLALQSAYLETDPLDVSQLTKDTTLTARLRIPSGLTVAEGTTVRVDLQVQPAQP